MSDTKTNVLPWLLVAALTAALAVDSVAQQNEASRKHFAETKDAAEKGAAEAQAHLGHLLEAGDGVAKDVTEAVKWYRKAAVQGNAEAQSTLGWRYAKGIGVPQDDTEAVKWYRKAAEQGIPEAQCNLAGCYVKGRGVPSDYAEAAKWFRRAADQGNAVAECAVGFCYAKGYGVKKDHAAAAEWYRKAADQENYEALDRLAWLLATCQDPRIRDGRTAVRYAEQAVAATGRTDSTRLETLAAAYAEAGDFEKAVSTQKDAIALLKDDRYKASFEDRLKLYKLRKPYHDDR